MPPAKPAPNKPRSTRTAAAPVQAVGLLGLGIMGSAMAGNLMKAGFTVYGHDPSASARKAFKAAGGTLCTDAQGVARRAQVIITSLPSPAALMASAHAIVEAAPRGMPVVETRRWTLPTRKPRAASSPPRAWCCSTARCRAPARRPRART